MSADVLEPPAKEAPVVSLEQVQNPFLIDTDLRRNQPEIEDAPTPTPEPTPTGEVAPETTPPEIKTPAAPETKPRDPSRKQLSEELAAATAERDKYREEIGTHEQKYKDAEAKRLEIEDKYNKHTAEFIAANTPKYDWQQDPEVMGPRKEVDDVFQETLIDLSPENMPTVKADIFKILDAYEGARKIGPEAVREIGDKITTKFGEEDGKRIFQMVRQIYPNHAKARDLQQKNELTHYERTLEGHMKRRREVTERFVGIGRATPEQIKDSPDDINSIISAAVAGDETMLKEIDVIVRKAADASAGLPPLPADATAEQAENWRQVNKAIESEKASAFQYRAQLRILAPIVKKLMAENVALKSRVTGAATANRTEARTSTPGKPAGEPGVPKGGDFSELQNPYAR